jgi:hypothetical protein
MRYLFHHLSLFPKHCLPQTLIRFPLIARAALSLKVASCLIDGEAVACDDDGLPVCHAVCHDRSRYRRHQYAALARGGLGRLRLVAARGRGKWQKTRYLLRRHVVARASSPSIRL